MRLLRRAAAIRVIGSGYLLDKAVRKGEIPTIKDGREKRYLESDLISWIESRRTFVSQGEGTVTENAKARTGKRRSLGEILRTDCKPKKAGGEP